MCIKFFFSSRRRHTRCLSDWSSDVCSSDLRGLPGLGDAGRGPLSAGKDDPPARAHPEERPPRPALPGAGGARSLRRRRLLVRLQRALAPLADPRRRGRRDPWGRPRQAGGPRAAGLRVGAMLRRTAGLLLLAALCRADELSAGDLVVRFPAPARPMAERILASLPARRELAARWLGLEPK